MPVLKLLLISLLIALSAMQTLALALPPADNQSFLQAEQAIARNDSKAAKKLFKKSKKHPLYSYLEYQQIKKEILNNKSKKNIFFKQAVSLKTIIQYRTHYPDSPLADKLLTLWLSHQGEQKNWKAFLAAYQTKPEIFSNTTQFPSLTCYKIRADYNQAPQATLLTPAIALWMSDKNQTPSCAPLFALLHQKKLITPEALFNKHQLLLEKKQEQLAKTLRSHMGPDYKAAAELWEKFIHNPVNLNNKKLMTQLQQNKIKARFKNQILVSSYSRYARINAAQTKRIFEKMQAQLPLTAEGKGEIIKNIAIYLAYQQDKQAAAWLKKIPKSSLDNSAREWQVRISLKQKKWKQTLQYINDLPITQQEEEQWIYWKARALEQTKQQNYKVLYEQLAKKRSYYGFLASETLGQAISLQHEPHPDNPEGVKKLETSKAFDRIQALRTLKRHVDVNREWYFMIAPLTMLEKTNAARLADKMKWHHLAIHTFNQSEHKNDIALRFPLAFEKLITDHAQKNKLDSAWVFALTRQESAFNFQAASPVGAMGLMQLMPATAKFIAKKTHPHVDTHDLTMPQTNINLGTQYLQYLHAHVNNPILSTASYNAGFSRVKKWLPSETDGSCDADIWIDNIPYEETRNYVKNILAFTSIYKHLQNQPFVISSMMPQVSPLSPTKKAPHPV